ncbi:MAG: hypothetical protein AAF559_12870 [Pseudomonadota bacterium]
MEHLTVFAIIFAYSAVAAALLLIPAVILGAFTLIIFDLKFPAQLRRRAALLATGVFPVMLLILELLAIAHIFSGQFRGPEGLGIVIFGLAAILAFIVVWPISYKLTLRLYRLRESDEG